MLAVLQGSDLLLHNYDDTLIMTLIMTCDYDIERAIRASNPGPVF